MAWSEPKVAPTYFKKQIFGLMRNLVEFPYLLKKLALSRCNKLSTELALGIKEMEKNRAVENKSETKLQIPKNCTIELKITKRYNLEKQHPDTLTYSWC